MEFRLYVDEVGNGDLKGAATDANIRYLSLTGVLTRKITHDRVIQPRFDTLKESLFGPVPAIPVVLHRRDLVRREGPFAILRDPEMLQTFNTAILSLFEDLPYLVITVLIDKKAHLERYGVWHYDPYHYCLRCLVERYIMYLQAHGFRGDVLIESRFKKADKRLKASFENIYKNGTGHLPARIIQSHLTSGDILMKPKIANVAGLQLADLLAHPSARYMRYEKDKLQQPDDFGARVARILVEKKYRRHPNSRRIEGFGLKWLP